MTDCILKGLYLLSTYPESIKDVGSVFDLPGWQLEQAVADELQVVGRLASGIFYNIGSLPNDCLPYGGILHNRTPVTEVSLQEFLSDQVELLVQLQPIFQRFQPVGQQNKGQLLRFAANDLDHGINI